MPQTIEERRAYQKQWRLANPERYKAAQRRWYERNREANRLRYQQDEEYRRKHAESNKRRYHERKVEDPSFLERSSRAAYGRKLLMKYGISIDDYERMSRAQGELCAICSRALKLVVDHCHDTGNVRGLLCDDCNVGLGRLGDSIERVAAALEYLNNAKARSALHDLRLVG